VVSLASNEPAHASGEAPLAHTPLYALHQELGAKLVPFAGTALPVRYGPGIIAEHNHTRSAASLFDVSHMGQLRITGPDAAAALEALMPADLAGLAPGRIRYSMLTNEAGGILDDLMAANLGGDWFIVVNGACKSADIERIAAGLSGDATLTVLEDNALLALQGPAAAAALARHAPQVAALPFMGIAEIEVAGRSAVVSRAGYTGEDGFEIAIAAADAEAFARRLLAEPEVEPAGLGARDSLRLEAGLCLYGHDIDETTTPVEAGLAWSIAKRRRAEGGYPGAEVIAAQLAQGATRRRVGLLPDGRAPAREGAAVLDANGEDIGRVTSGAMSPTLGAPIAMGYVRADCAAPGTGLGLLVRDVARPARVAPLPFVAHRYYRSSSH
jgi:aminomethyltransferase